MIILQLAQLLIARTFLNHFHFQIQIYTERQKMSAVQFFTSGNHEFNEQVNRMQISEAYTDLNKKSNVTAPFF